MSLAKVRTTASKTASMEMATWKRSGDTRPTRGEWCARERQREANKGDWEVGVSNRHKMQQAGNDIHSTRRRRERRHQRSLRIKHARRLLHSLPHAAVHQRELMNLLQNSLLSIARKRLAPDASSCGLRRRRNRKRTREQPANELNDLLVEHKAGRRRAVPRPLQQKLTHAATTRQNS